MHATLRQERVAYSGNPRLLERARCHFEVDVRDAQRLDAAIRASEADVVVNAIGIVKQRDAAQDAIRRSASTRCLPHQLAELRCERGARLIHFSTDCVFTGDAGRLQEDDVPDAVDLYGRTKLLGEVAERRRAHAADVDHRPGADGTTGLVEWFLAQRGPSPRLRQRDLHAA